MRLGYNLTQHFTNMDQAITDHLTNLLLQAREQDIKLYLSAGELVMKTPKGRVVAPLLLETIKTNKAQLITYLSKQAHLLDENTLVIEEAGQPYYKVTPGQYWWVSDEVGDKAFKEKVFGLFNFRINGYFNVDAFKRAVAYLVDRHESLRSTFHKLRGHYYMRVEPAGAALFDVQVTSVVAMPPAEKESFVSRFLDDGYLFNLQEGPLFIAALLQLEEQQYLLTLKMHHSIYDVWSGEVMLGDLFAAYKALAGGEAPVLPPLGFQYREYMVRTNDFMLNNEAAHKKYWTTQYPTLPEELNLPGKKRSNKLSFANRIYKKEVFPIPLQTVVALTAIGKTGATTLFVVLQAVLRKYVYHLTGQAAIVTDTQVFGRDLMPGLEEQIGFFAKMVAISTVITPGDSLKDIVNKVKAAYAEATQYRAWSLLQTLRALLPAEEKADVFSLRIQYHDVNEYASKRAGASGSTVVDRVVLKKQRKKINNDLKLEFNKFQDNVSIQVTYDGNIYEDTAIRQLIQGFIDCMDECIVANAHHTTTHS